LRSLPRASEHLTHTGKPLMYNSVSVLQNVQTAIIRNLSRPTAGVNYSLDCISAVRLKEMSVETFWKLSGSIWTDTKPVAEEN